MAGRQGFTLIELILVVVIAGILAAVAVPRFLAVANGSRAAEADPLLRHIQTLQERYHARTGGYAANLTDLEGGSNVTTTGKYFQLTMTAHATGYCVTAEANAQAANFGLTSRSLDATGEYHDGDSCP